MEETKETVREGTLPGRRRSEGSVVASAMWGAGILVSIAIIAGATAISFAILRGEMFGVVGSEKQAVIEEKTKEPSAKNVPPAQAPTPPEEKSTGSTTLGTAPILGNMKTAKVAIIEWSDLECPFCKKFHDDTFDNIVKDYVDTGKAVFSSGIIRLIFTVRRRLKRRMPRDACERRRETKRTLPLSRTYTQIRERTEREFRMRNLEASRMPPPKNPSQRV